MLTFDKKEERRESEQLENNSEQILDNLRITAVFCIVNLLHFIVSLLKINMNETKKKKKKKKRNYLKDLPCFLFPFFVSWEIFCNSVQFKNGFKNLFVVYFFRLILLFLGCSHAWKSIFLFYFVTRVAEKIKRISLLLLFLKKRKNKSYFFCTI